MNQVSTKYKKTEIGVIPEDWEVKKFSEVTNAITCGVAATPQYVSESLGKPFLSASHVQNGKVLAKDFKFITIELYNQITKNNKPEKGDVLYTRVGSGIGEAGVIEVDFDFAIYVSLTLIKPKKILDSYFLKSLLNSNHYRFLANRDQFAGAGVQNLNVQVVKEFPIPIPTIAEQTAIATALSDADALINSIEKLIAKKRNIKQGAMQKLLKPKADWVIKKFGEVLKVKHGKSQKQIEDINGKYPILGTGGLMGFTNHFLYNKPSVLIGRKGTIDKPQFMETPFWTVDTLFYTEIFEGYNGKFIFYAFNLIDWYSYNEASGVPSLNAKTIEKIERGFPSPEEQNRIAIILSDMDTEIAAMETKLVKYKQIKQGMMQNLLTGKIRLV